MHQTDNSTAGNNPSFVLVSKSKADLIKKDHNFKAMHEIVLPYARFLSS